MVGGSCSLFWVSGAAGRVRFPPGAVSAQFVYSVQCLLMTAEIAKVKN